MQLSALRSALLSLLLLAGLAAVPAPAAAASSYDQCTGFIDAVPATIDAPGVWCLRSDLVVPGPDAGYMITIMSDDVTLDCTGHSLTDPNLPSDSVGVEAFDRHRVTVRNCTIAGFHYGIDFSGWNNGITIEDNVVRGGRTSGISLGGDSSVVRRNQVRGMHGGFQMAAIWVAGNVDVIDNTIDDIDGGNGHAWGIVTGNGVGRQVVGNRIRGLRGQYGEGAAGIYVMGSGPANVRDNDIAGDMVAGSHTGSRGVYCEMTEAGAASRARIADNIIAGFPQGSLGCIDAGGNDVSY